MEIISGVIGVLGFFLALFTFIITRIERRKSLSIELLCSEHEDWSHEIPGDNDGCFIIARLVNDGERRLHLNPKTAQFHLDGKPIDKLNMDFFGESDIPYPLNPGQSVEIGIIENIILGCAGIQLRKNLFLKIDFTIKDNNARIFKNKVKYEYIPEVGEIEKL